MDLFFTNGSIPVSVFFTDVLCHSFFSIDIHFQFLIKYPVSKSNPANQEFKKLAYQSIIINKSENTLLPMIWLHV